MDLSEMAQVGQRYAGMVVLLAESNPVNELTMRQQLLRLGCTVRVARGGTQANALWEQGGIDLILMDVQMPGMGGLEATQKIRGIEARRKLPRVPIVAVTVNAMSGERAQCLAVGMDGYVAKPVSPQALMKEIDQAMKRPASSRPDRDSARNPAPATALPAAWITARTDALDVEKLRRRLNGDQETLKQLALALRTDLAARQREMQRALEARDSASAVAHAHDLGGSLVSMTAERGARLAKGLGLAARAGDWRLFERALPLMQSEAQAIDKALMALLAVSGGDLFGDTASSPRD